MLQPRNRSLSGAMRMQAAQRRRGITLTVRSLFAEPRHCEVSLRLLDRHHFERPWIGGDGRALDIPLQQVVVNELSTSPEDDRLRQVLGVDALFRGTCQLEIPLTEWQAASYVGLEWRCVESFVTTGGDRLTLEVPKRGLGGRRAAGPRLHWLLTKPQAESRLHAIAEHYSLDHWTDEASTDALTHLLFLIYSGIDSPILTEPIDPPFTRRLLDA
jgi:hypothetical protein